MINSGERSDQINYMSNIENFRRLWDVKRIEEASGSKRTNQNVNPNCDNSDPFSSKTYIWWEEEFINHIELGVRRLVEIIVFDLKYITFSSCEGHTHELTRQIQSLRHVSILPRHGERRAILNRFSGIAEELNRHGLPCKVSVLERDLITDDFHKYYGIDIIFHPDEAGDNEYFNALETCYEKFCDKLIAGAQSLTLID